MLCSRRQRLLVHAHCAGHRRSCSQISDCEVCVCWRSTEVEACRVDVGGKHLTNHLKEVLSYRQLVVMDETYAINECKHTACYISDDFRRDMLSAACVCAHAHTHTTRMQAAHQFNRA
jgi:hypothetical protein